MDVGQKVMGASCDCDCCCAMGDSSDNDRDVGVASQISICERSPLRTPPLSGALPSRSGDQVGNELVAVIGLRVIIKPHRSYVHRCGLLLPTD